MRALWLSLTVLGLTASVQAIVVVLFGSTALLADTLHNLADALTALPVGIAFLLARRPPNRRFTYGYGRAEDLAGVIVVLVIAGSAVAALVESAQGLVDPERITRPLVIAAAGVSGFIGNEIAARIRMRTGRKIGSAALIADGLHARSDAFASFGVVLAAGGSALGWRYADALVGLAIGFAIATITYSAGKQVLGRLLDSVDPELVDRATRALADHPDVRAVDAVRLRWVGHTLRAEVELSVSDELALARAHEIAHEAEQKLSEAISQLSAATVHAHPARRAAHHAV